MSLSSTSSPSSSSVASIFASVPISNTFELDSVWEFIKRHTPDPEHEDLRRLIGVKLITDIEDLQKETVFLKEIHDEYREETNELSSQKNAIFENEFQRNALVSKIRFLVEQIKEKTHTFNKDDSLRRGSRESFVVDYALSQENATPRRSGSFISDRSIHSRCSTPASDVLNSINAIKVTAQSNARQTQFIVQELRDHLNEERVSLLQQVEMLHQNLESEKDSRIAKQHEIPTINELSQVEKRLESHLSHHDHVARIQTLPSITHSQLPPLVYPAMPPNSVKSSYTSSSDHDVKLGTNTKEDIQDLLAELEALDEPIIYVPSTTSTTSATSSVYTISHHGGANRIESVMNETYNSSSSQLSRKPLPPSMPPPTNANTIRMQRLRKKGP